VQDELAKALTSGIDERRLAIMSFNTWFLLWKR